jgi:molybdopterin-guanine dinucleotide biosynthesis protein MobB
MDPAWLVWALKKVNMRMNILAICGIKNAGKTTLIERVLPLLQQQSIRVGVIKHDGHRYEADVPGTDSFRYLQASAEAVAIYDAEKFTITRRGNVSPETIFHAFSDMDLILVEGFKNTNCAKIEIVREEISTEPISNPENRLAIISDCLEVTDLPVFLPDDMENIASFIMNALRENKLAMETSKISNL